MSEIEELKARIADLKRTLWMVVRAAGGRVVVFDDLAQKFDPDRCVLLSWQTADLKSTLIEARIDLEPHARRDEA